MNFSLNTNGTMMIQPQNISEDSAHRKKAWETFTSTGKILEDAGLNSLVTVSWMRCSLRMNPKGPLNWAYASDNALKSTLKQHTTLRNIARPIMEDIYQFLEDCHVALF